MVLLRLSPRAEATFLSPSSHCAGSVNFVLDGWNNAEKTPSGWGTYLRREPGHMTHGQVWPIASAADTYPSRQSELTGCARLVQIQRLRENKGVGQVGLEEPLITMFTV